MNFLKSTLLLFMLPFIAQGGNWIRFQGGTANDGSGGVNVTSSGEVIHCNWFSGQITVNAQSYISSGGTDILICKTNGAGAYQWVTRLGGLGDDRTEGVWSDNAGNIYVWGYFSSSLTAGTSTINSAGGLDGFVLKMDASGNVLWMQSAGGIYNDLITSVTVDGSGNIYCTGNFTGSATFGPYGLTSYFDPTNTFYSQDVFITSLSSSGAYQWVRKGGSKYPDQGVGIASDNSGNIYVTGQYSDTIQFVNQHPNTILNAVFIVKYSPAGNELWFNNAGGGALSNVRGIVSNGTNAFYLAGECIGSMQFFGSPVITSTSLYANRVFVARYDFNGQPLWVKSDGSTSPVRAAAIDLDNDENIYLAGLFHCKFSEYADQYGQGVFNSIGFNDVFVSKYDTTGIRKWSRQAGGPAEDDVNGLSINEVDTPVISGTFSKRFICASSTAATFVNYGPNSLFVMSATAPLFINCGDTHYGSFQQATSAGASDLFFGKIVDLSRLPYDYYKRTVSTCSPDPVPGCVSVIQTDNNCQDQLTPTCGGLTLYGVTNTSSTNPFSTNNSPGPDFNYLWSTGATTRSYLVNASGTYTVTMTSADGCFSTTDSMTVIVNQIPSQPTISDSKNININASQTTPINLCAPDSITLIATNVVPGVTVTWTYNTVTTIGPTLTIHANTFQITSAVVRYTTSAGCTAQNVVLIRVDTGSLAPIHPFLQVPDTASACGNSVDVTVVDSTTMQPCNIANLLNVYWQITPFAPVSAQGCFLNQRVVVTPTVSGNYTIQATIVRIKCGLLDSTIVSKTVYIQAGTPPIVNGGITGQQFTEICPGSSATFTASGGTSYMWSTGETTASITVNTVGNFCVTVTVDSGGCTADQQFCRQVTTKQSPIIYAGPDPIILCPNDSVLISVVTGGAIFSWTGPGLFNANDDTVYASQPGFYFCNVTDSTGCQLISNSVELIQYATPYIFVSPNTVFCQGDTVSLAVQSSGNAIIQWDFPFSGSSPVQYALDDGLYTCSVTSCGITTVASATLTMIQVSAFIPQADTAICFGDSLVLTPLPFTGSAMWLPDSTIGNTYTVHAGASYIVQITDPNGCSAYSNIVIVDVDTVLPPTSITVNSPVCEGESVLLSPTLPGGITANWTGPGGFTSSFTDVIIDTITSGQSGYYVITATNGQCFSDPDSVQVIVYDSVPRYNITATSLCAGTTVDIMTTPTLNYTFSWTTPAGSTVTDTLIRLSNYNASYSGYYVLNVSNGTCPTYLDSIFLGLPNTGSIAITASDTIACNGETISVSALSTPGTLDWHPGGNIPSVNLISSGQVYCVLTDSSGCNYFSDTLQVNFNAPPSISNMNDLLACVGDNVLLNATVLNGTVQQPGYLWTGPSGTFSNQLNPVINPVSAADQGIYVLTVIDSVCQGVTDTLNLQVNTIPPAPLITSVLPQCVGDQLLLVAAVGSGTTAGFINPAGTTIQTDSLLISVTTSADSGWYTCYSEVAACPVSVSTILVEFDSCKVAESDWAIPNIFSPNSDGVNDVFTPTIPMGEDGTMKIYNRWGDLVFTGIISKGWDGREEGGKEQPAGVYYWIMLPSGTGNFTLKERSGFVELVR